MADHTVFTVVCHYDISDEAYKVASRFKTQPTRLLMSTILHGIGTTSLHFTTSMFDVQTKLKLASLSFKYILIDKLTRRPKNIPDWFIAKHQHLNPGHKTPDWIASDIPADVSRVHRKKYTVRFSDTDANRHLNNNMFIRICFDAAAEAASNHLFINFTNEFFTYRVKAASCEYRKECRPNEEVEVHVWEELKDSSIHFFMVNLTKQVVCFACRVVFHNPDRVLQNKL